MKYGKLTPHIEETYTISASYSITSFLTTCDCKNCITQEEIELLVATPLRELSRDLIDTCISTIFESEDRAIVELRYFLPRMLELLSQGEILYISEGFSLSKCHFEHRDIWEPAESVFIERFVKTLFNEVLKGENPDLCDSAEDWLVCSGLSDLSIAPLLNTWLRQTDKVVALCYFEEFLTHNFRSVEIAFRHSYFRDRHPELNEQITAWLMSSRTQQISLQTTENLLLSDTELEEEVLFPLENLYNQLMYLKNEGIEE